MPDPRRQLPQVDAFTNELAEHTPDLPRPIVAAVARRVLARARGRLGRGAAVAGTDLRAVALDDLRAHQRQLIQSVINATGVVLHTNLGRAPLSVDAIDAVVAVAAGYSNLEWDRGRRGDRYTHVEPMLATLTGAQAAIVVNNNAAAVLLVCAGLAADGEVIVSRGELIEIGGAFRIPDVLEVSGATLREVGTTNRTRTSDFAKAVGPATAMILKVHPSNYRVEGFTSEATIEELAGVAKKAKVPLVHDIGSGLIGRSMSDEPSVDASLKAGADLVCFSGDKLMGGPQAGIVVGRRALIDRLKTHPFVRAVRPDKMQLAALGATVHAYLTDGGAGLPTWQMLDATAEELKERAASLTDRLSAAGLDPIVTEEVSVVGGGSVPGSALPTSVVRIATSSPSRMARRLAEGQPQVAVRTVDGAILIDPRTVLPTQEADLISAVTRAFG